MKLKFFIFLIVVLYFSVTNIYSNNNALERKIDSLLSKMTLKEKIGQMNQENFKSLNDELLEKVRKGEVSSFLNITNAEDINKLQMAAKESRLGIPLIIGRDVIHGFKTIFPIPLGQAASFNPQLVEEGAHIAAVEARSVGVNWTFTPMLDISRDARWGRIAESFGEDPYLVAKLGTAMVKGFQGKDMSDNKSIASCVKHFAGYGAAEGGRDYNSTNIPPNLFRNVYLFPFEAAVKAGAATIMTSFNDNDGIPSSANKFLLKNVLRDEWKFDGFVVSDWCSMSEMITHGFAKDRKHVAELSVNAGLDMEMVSGTYSAYLEQLMNEGKVSVQVIDALVRNILRIKFRLGLFENAITDTNSPTVMYADNHLQKAEQAAVESIVMLKNNQNTLPLRQVKKIAIIGPLANAAHDQLGTWVFDGEKSHTITPLKAMQTDYRNIEYVYIPVLTHSRDTNKSNFKKLNSVIKKCDAVIAFVGEESILSGEAHSLSSINLPGVQSELLCELKKAGKPLVVVVMAGRPLTIERDLKNADALLYSFHPGTMGGPALMNVIFGKENPSGKLPVTFVREVGQIPMYYNHNRSGRPALGNEVLLHNIPREAPQHSLGNTSFYLDSGQKPLFPFGYGLSYSKFEYSNLVLSTNQIKMGEKISIRTKVKNNSNVDGTEVVQFYIQDVVGSIVRPVKELKGFQRVFIKANETKEVEFTISTNDLAFWTADMTYKAEPGEFNVWIGGDSDSGLKDSFTVE